MIQIFSNLQDGNLKAIGSSNWSAGHARGNIALTSGKWFWESTYSAGSSTLQFGFANTSASLTESYGSVPANSWTYYFPNSSICILAGELILTSVLVHLLVIQLDVLWIWTMEPGSSSKMVKVVQSIN